MRDETLSKIGKIGDASALLEALFSSSPMPYAVFGADGHAVVVNAAYRELFGDAPPVEPGLFDDEAARARGIEEHIARACRGETVMLPAEPHGAAAISRTLIPLLGGDGAVTHVVIAYHDAAAEERLAFLVHAGRVLGSSLDYQKTLQALVELAVPRLADFCNVDMLDEHGVPQKVAMAHADPRRMREALEMRRRFPPDPAMTRGILTVLESGRPELYERVTDELVADTIQDPEYLRAVRKLGLSSVLLVPIAVHDKVLGVLTMVYAESGRRYGKADLALAAEIASRAAFAIEHARLYAEAQTAIRLRDEFLQVASHELRTPLTTLELLTSALVGAAEQGQTDALKLARAQRLDAQVGRLKHLVDELLDVSRIAAGRFALELADVDVGALADEVVARFREQARRAGASLAVTTTGDARVRADPNRVDQVLTNLLANALKYGGGSPVRVDVEADAAGVWLKVSDEGPGIAPEDHARIFQRFERASSTRHHGGMGLGLWIVKQILDAHGGRITVESAPGRGTTFGAWLPRVPAGGAR